MNGNGGEVATRSDGGALGIVAHVRIQNSQNITINSQYSTKFAYLNGTPAYHYYITGSNRVKLNQVRGTAPEGGLDPGEAPRHTIFCDSESRVSAEQYEFALMVGIATSTNGVSCDFTYLETDDGLVAIGATTIPYATFSVLGRDITSTTMALRPTTTQTANIFDIYNTLGNLDTVINSSNNLGLGTTSPGSKLSVNGTSYFNGNMSITGNLRLAGTGTETIDLFRGNTSSFSAINFGTNGSGKWALRQSNDGTENLYLRDTTNGRNKLTFIQGTDGILIPDGLVSQASSTFMATTTFSDGLLARASSTVNGELTVSNLNTPALTVRAPGGSITGAQSLNNQIRFIGDPTYGYGIACFHVIDTSRCDTLMQAHHAEHDDPTDIHDHFSIYTTNAARSETLKRVNIPFKQDIANWTFENSTLEIQGNGGTTSPYIHVSNVYGSASSTQPLTKWTNGGISDFGTTGTLLQAVNDGQGSIFSASYTKPSDQTAAAFDLGGKFLYSGTMAASGGYAGNFNDGGFSVSSSNGFFRLIRTNASDANDTLKIDNRSLGASINVVSNTTQRFIVTAAGLVGVATSTPRADLAGNGSMMISGTSTLASVNATGTVITSGLPTETGTAIHINASNQLTKAASSRRYKDNIEDLQLACDKLADLRPRSFTWKSSGNADFGLIAEEVAEVYPELVVYNKDGQPEAVRYDLLSVVLLECQDGGTQPAQQGFNPSWFGLLGLFGIIPLLRRKH